MNTATKTRLDVVPLTKHIGAEIRGIDLREKPDDDTIKAIYQAWLDHLVIIFPDQKLSQEDFVRATGFFGEHGRDFAAGQILPQGLLEPAARHHDDLQHPRERRADRRAARRRDDVPSRHDPRRKSRARAPCSIRSKSPRPAATRCSPAATRPTTRSIRRSATAWRAASPSIITITAPWSKTIPRRPQRSPKARIRCSAPTRRPAARRSTSTV